MAYKEIKIPQVNVNDEQVTIEDIVFNNLDKVAKGDVIFSISTAKAIEDYICEDSGYIVYLVSEGDEIDIGATVAYIFDTEEEAKSKLNEIENKEEKIEIKATKKAIKFAQEKNFDLSQIKKDGIITVKDIKKFFGI